MEEGAQSNAQNERSNYSKIAATLLEHPTIKRFVSEKVLYILLLSITFLLPVFFIPGGSVALEFSKMVFVEVVVLAGVIIWAIERLRDGHLVLPKSLLLLVGLLLVVQFVVAALVSPTPSLSFIGSGYDLGTVNTFVVLFLLLFLSSLVFSNRDKILLLYAGIIFSGTLLALYHILRYFFGAEFLNFGLFSSAIATPIGKWNDLVSLFGSLMILGLTTMYFFPKNSIIRVPFYGIYLIGTFFLLLIDFKVLWSIIFVITGLLVAVAIYEGELSHKKKITESAGQEGGQKHHPVHKRVVGHLPMFTTILLVLSFLYMSGLASMTFGANNKSLRGIVATALKSPVYSEVVLTPELTTQIVSSSLKSSPLFGVGPNRFSASFLQYKSSDINKTPFWDTAFDFGLGRIPTFFGTTGSIGMLLWVVFLGLLLYKSRRIFAMISGDRVAAFIATSLFLLTLYFWSLAFFYLPGIAIYSLAFIFTGALIAFLVSEGVLGKIEFGFAKHKKFSAVVTPIFIVLLISAVASGVLLTRQISSLVAFRDAQLALSVGNIDQAEIFLTAANKYSEQDSYHRALSNIALARLQQLPSQNLPQEQLAAKANQFVGDARSNAERAITLDPTNFENFLQLGSVYDSLGMLGIQNTTGFARDNYEKSLALNPKSPRILFLLGRLEYAAGNKDLSKQYLTRSLQERPNYFEALSFYVQLELSDGNTAKAVDAINAGLSVEPGNFLLHFALGYLYYSQADYQLAIREFEYAVAINPVYADAKYFLGLSYEKVGRSADALAQFNDVQTLNPDNKDVPQIIRNIKAGRDPFGPGFTPAAQSATDALNQLNQNGGTR